MKTSDPVTLDLTRLLRVHLVGIGGHGMSALALVLAGMGHRVSGSDLRPTPVLDRLRAAGIRVDVGQRAEQVVGADVVGVSTAVPEHNVEVVAARAAGIPVVHRSKLLGAVSRVRPALAIAGTHGKTTTTTMVAAIAVAAGLDPSTYIGAEVHEPGSGARWGSGPWFVVEADESDGTFLELRTAAAVLTNVDIDHLDHWGDLGGLHDAFARFLAAVEGPVVVCADDPVAARLGAAVGARTYGTSPRADVRCVDRVPLGPLQRFAVELHGTRLGEVTLPMRGEHLARNATGAIAVALALGAGFDAAVAGLARLAGIARRFEPRGRVEVSADATTGPAELVDDYAHLPAEIAAVLRSAAEDRPAATGGRVPGRTVAVFQPNRFSRMAELSPAYADAFVDADVVVIADIYPSGEAPLPGVTGALVVDAVRAAHPDAEVHYVAERDRLAAATLALLRPGDRCISMGCGDIEHLPDEIAALAQDRP